MWACVDGVREGISIRGSKAIVDGELHGSLQIGKADQGASAIGREENAGDGNHFLARRAIEFVVTGSVV
jgi:hypothetical protein